jgi:hypothetical protein
LLCTNLGQLQQISVTLEAERSLIGATYESLRPSLA